MSAAVGFPWLGRAFVVALVVHGGIVALLLVAALWVAGVGVGADSAPDGVGSVLMAVPVLLAALPSGVALLSAWMCRRRGWRPSATHMALSTGAAVLFLLLFLGSYLT
ncbi:MAG: hypothetical protein RID23_18890 [Roseovarius sp.]